MAFFKKLKKTAKDMPVPVWIAGLIIPGGFIAIATYMAWKASRKDKPHHSFREFLDSLLEEERQKDDRSEDRS